MSQAALSRTDTPEAKRRPFALYVDEFQNFINEGFDVILSEAHKYKLSLTLAHQNTGQVSGPLLDNITGNVASLIAFSVNADDAAYVARNMAQRTTVHKLTGARLDADARSVGACSQQRAAPSVRRPCGGNTGKRGTTAAPVDERRAPSLVTALACPTAGKNNSPKRRAAQSAGCSRRRSLQPMTQSPTATAIADAIAELNLYADTTEAEEARALVALLDQLDEIDPPAVY